MMNERASGQTKGTEFTRPLSIWRSVMKKILKALLCVTDDQTDEQNLIYTIYFLWGSKRIYDRSEPQKII